MPARAILLAALLAAGCTRHAYLWDDEAGCWHVRNVTGGGPCAGEAVIDAVDAAGRCWRLICHVEPLPPGWTRAPLGDPCLDVWEDGERCAGE